MHGHVAAAGADSPATAVMGVSGGSGAGVSHSPMLGADSAVDVAPNAASKRRKRSRKVTAQEEEHFDEYESTGDEEVIQSEPKRRKRGKQSLCGFPCEPPCDSFSKRGGKCKRHGGG